MIRKINGKNSSLNIEHLKVGDDVVGWLVGWLYNATLTAKCHIMAVGDAYVFPSFLTRVLTQLFFPKPPTTFLTCFCRGERRKYAGKKSRLNRGSNS